MHICSLCKRNVMRPQVSWQEFDEERCLCYLCIDMITSIAVAQTPEELEQAKKYEFFEEFRQKVLA